MNEIVNKVLLSGDKFIPENHLRQQEFTHSACVPFMKNKERTQKFKETGDSRYISQKELALKNSLLSKILLEEQLLIKYFMIKHLILLKIQNMRDIKEVLLQWSLSFLIKKLLVVVLKMKIFLIMNYQKNYINQFLENLRKEHYNQLF